MLAPPVTGSDGTPWIAGTPSPAKARVSVITWLDLRAGGERRRQVHEQRRQAAAVARPRAVQPGVDEPLHEDLDDPQRRGPRPVRGGDGQAMRRLPVVEGQLREHARKASRRALCPQSGERFRERSAVPERPGRVFALGRARAVEGRPQ